MKPLHNALKISWLIGLLSTIFFSFQSSDYLVISLTKNPFILLGIGFIFVSLTGLFIKEAFCFNRLEAKFLTVIIPTLLLGYMLDFLPIQIEQFLLTSWCFFILSFCLT